MRNFLRHRTLLILCTEAGLVLVTYYCSFLLRFDFDPAEYYLILFGQTLLPILIIKLLTLYAFGLLSGWWRYAGITDLLNIAKAAFISSILLYAVILFGFSGRGFPRSVIAIDFVLTIVVVGGARFVVRAYTEQAGKYLAQKNALIVGAGQAGISLAHELKRDPSVPYWPVGFVDDDPSKQGLRMCGLKVLGAVDDLARLVAHTKVDCVLIAIPANGRQISRIIDKCHACKVDFRILADINHRLNGHAALGQVRNVCVEDLLRREPVRLDQAAISARLRDKAVLVTGAGGSIGSEIVRQLSSFKPKRLILFERSENDLFHISTELASTLPNLDFVPVVGDILDVNLLRDVFARHHPDSVFHAAAYKHVPMMEKNCFQAVTNNIFGTYNVALVARQHEVGDFVMISSDKAVNPTNIMGVTKRVAELIMLSLQDARTRFVAVRFGNVLGSNGSVLPLWEQQIARGGPVTVTHPEAKRYFMTIPEAVQLVLQASAMGNGGEIFVLDMGEPVEILGLAKDVIRLSGMVPEQEIPLVFTGLRPGEKLFEELRLNGEGMKATYHEKIRVLDGGGMQFGRVQSWLDELSALVESKNVYQLVTLLREIVPEYTPSPEILALCEVDRYDRGPVYNRSRAQLSMTARGAA
jgi:FlaA1/EpsC-like NDP-sugar epimerase